MLVDEFYLDGARWQVASGRVSNKVVTLRLKEASAAQKIIYLKEISWSQERLLRGTNGIATLVLCELEGLLPGDVCASE